MKSFKETFDLINHRLKNLEGLIKLQEINIKENNYPEHFNQSELDRLILEKDTLLLQDSQLRDFIINDKQ